MNDVRARAEAIFDFSRLPANLPEGDDGGAKGASKPAGEGAAAGQPIGADEPRRARRRVVRSQPVKEQPPKEATAPSYRSFKRASASSPRVAKTAAAPEPEGGSEPEVRREAAPDGAPVAPAPDGASAAPAEAEPSRVTRIARRVARPVAAAAVDVDELRLEEERRRIRAKLSDTLRQLGREGRPRSPSIDATPQPTVAAGASWMVSAEGPDGLANYVVQAADAVSAAHVALQRLLVRGASAPRLRSVERLHNVIS